MKKLSFIRHAESVANVGNLLAGQSDFPLSEKGLADALRLAERLRDDLPDALYSSPLTRAMQTIHQVGTEQVFLLDLSKRPRTLMVTVDDASWGGVKQ